MEAAQREMATTFRSGSSYTIEELAELARRGMEEAGVTQAQAADVLNARASGERQLAQPQVSQALREPARYPGTVLRLVEAFTGYEVEEVPRYAIRRRAGA